MRTVCRFLIASILWSVPAFAGPDAAGTSAAPYVSCREDAAKYSLRSDELQHIVAADQADRPNNVLKPGALNRDRQRSERVGTIFGEGCFWSMVRRRGAIHGAEEAMT